MVQPVSLVARLADAKALLAVGRCRKAGWVDHVNEPLTESELKAVQHSIQPRMPVGRPNMARPGGATSRSRIHSSGLTADPKSPKSVPDTFSKTKQYHKISALTY